MHAPHLQTVMSVAPGKKDTTFFFRFDYPPSSTLCCLPEGCWGILPLVQDTEESGRGRQQGPALSLVCQSIREGPVAQQGLVCGCRARSCLLGLVLKQTQ